MYGDFGFNQYGSGHGRRGDPLRENQSNGTDGRAKTGNSDPGLLAQKPWCIAKAQTSGRLNKTVWAKGGHSFGVQFRRAAKQQISRQLAGRRSGLKTVPALAREPKE